MPNIKDDPVTPREKICTMNREELKGFILSNDPKPNYYDGFFEESRIHSLRCLAHEIAIHCHI